MAAACVPGSSGLLRCHPGGKRPVGPEGQVVPASGKNSFLVQDWESNAFGLLLILADNYNLTTNKFTTETRSAQRTHRDSLAERSVAGAAACDPCGPLAAAPGSPSTVGGAAALVAAAYGPDRAGLLRCRPGGLDCLASARARGQWAGWA